MQYHVYNTSDKYAYTFHFYTGSLIVGIHIHITHTVLILLLFTMHSVVFQGEKHKYQNSHRIKMIINLLLVHKFYQAKLHTDYTCQHTLDFFGGENPREFKRKSAKTVQTIFERDTLISAQVWRFCIGGRTWLAGIMKALVSRSAQVTSPDSFRGGWSPPLGA